MDEELPYFDRPWVLVIDDDPEFRALVSTLLQQAGIAIACAADGAQAVDSCVRARRPPAAILLDLTLPKLDGEAALAEMRRAHGNEGELAVVLVSGALRPGDLESVAHRLGALAALTKPCDMDELLATVKRMLPRR